MSIPVNSGVALPSLSTLLYCVSWFAICLFGLIQPVEAVEVGSGQEGGSNNEVGIDEECNDDEDSLENDSVEKIASILEEPDEPEVLDEELDATGKTPLVIEGTGDEPLIMITWQRYVVNVIIITCDILISSFIQIPIREKGWARLLEHHNCIWKLHLH